MMSTSYYWIKLYFDLLDDYKVGNLPDSLKWRFIQCLLIAGETMQDGFLPKLDEMAFRIRPITPESLNDDLARLAKPGLVELRIHPDGDERWFVTKFEERQGRISNAERQRAWRARKSTQNNEDVTDIKQDSNDSVTGRYEEESRIDKKREEQEKKQPTPSLEIPPNLNNHTFLKVWEDWKRYKGSSIKNMTYQKQLDKASEQCNLHGVNAVIDVFELTMSNGWKGLFWDRIQASGKLETARPVIGEF